jgi:hypothetical protein
MKVPKGKSKIHDFSNSCAALDNNELLEKASDACISLGYNSDKYGEIIDSIKADDVDRLEKLGGLGMTLACFFL